MPSSTFSSETTAAAVRPASRKSIALLLVTIALLLLAFEAGTRMVIERKSKVQREVNEEYAKAIAIRKGDASHPKQLLVVGNSLVGFGIDMPALQRSLPSGWQAHEFWIYNTNYDDWYFGLRRLLADGSRPDAIAIVMAAMNWNASGIRGDYSSQYLFRSADIPAVQSQLGLDRSTASGLLLSRFSKAYALRGEVRKIILNQIIPDLPRMYALFQPGPARHIPDERVVEVASRRMASYKDVAAAYGIPIIAVVPPITPPNEEYHSALRTAASRAGIQIAIPTEARNLPPSDFADDIHLSKRGASVFTEQLGKVLGGNLTSAAATPGNIEAAVPARP